MMPVAYRSSAEQYSASANSITCSKPAGTVDGDLMIAHAYCNAPADVITPPAGWTVIATKNTDITGRMTIYYKFASSEGASYIWEFDSTQRCKVSIHAFSGTAQSNPINVSAIGTVAASSNTIIAPTLTTTVANTLAVFIYNADSGLSITYTKDASVTQVFNSGYVVGCVQVCTLAMAVAGATGAKTSGIDNTISTGLAFSIALAPPAAGKKVYGTAMSKVYGVTPAKIYGV
jgi:hypothetical protein